MNRDRSWWRILAVVCLSVAAASAVRTFFHVVFKETIPYTPFYPAIIVSTMYGRVRGGLLGIVIAALAAAVWLSPLGRLFIEESTDLIGMLLFISVSTLIVVLSEGMLRARQRAEDAVTEQERLLRREQAARREAEDANRLKDEFLAMVSHELRTPLHAILGWVELLRRPDLGTDSRRHGLEVIERNSHAQTRLVEDLLDVSRIVAGKMRLSRRLINPRAVVEAAINTVSDAAQAREIRIIRQFDETAHTLSVDPDRFQQVAWNLLSNAIKFSPTGSVVTVVLQRTDGAVRLQVVDQGCGIPEDSLPHVFERFHQVHEGSSRHGGLGLGLAIVKSLVELHGGTVHAASGGHNQGTAITVELPHVALPAKSAGTSRGRLAGLRLLVVDDDPEALDLVRRVLEEQQAEVSIADSGRAALDSLSHGRPDVIISDIAMPQLDGYEMLRELRTRQSEQDYVPAVALTARCSDEDRARAYAAGYELHLSKPINPGRLAEAVAELACSRN